MINTLIKQFESDLVALVNASQIPIACKQQVMENVLHEVRAATEKAIANEAAAEAEKAQEEAE